MADRLLLKYYSKGDHSHYNWSEIIPQMKETEGNTNMSWSEKMKTFDNYWFMAPEERTESDPGKHSVSNISSSYDGRSELRNSHYPKPLRKAPSTKKYAQVKRLFKRKNDFFLQVYPGYKPFKLEEKEIKNLKKEKNNLASEREKLLNEISFYEKECNIVRTNEEIWERQIFRLEMYKDKGDHIDYDWERIEPLMKSIQPSDKNWCKTMKKFDNNLFTTPGERMQYGLEKYSDSGLLTFNDDEWSEIMSIYSVLNPQGRELSTKKNARVKRLYKRKRDFFLQVYSSYKLLQLEKKRDSKEEIRKLLDTKLTGEKKALQKEISSDKKNFTIVSANGSAGSGEACSSLEFPQFAPPHLTCDRSLGPPLIPTNEESGKQIFRAQTEANQGMDAQSIGRVMEIKEGTDMSGKEKKTFDDDWFMTPEERTESKPEKHSVSSFSSSYDGRNELRCRHYPKPLRKAPTTKRPAQVKRLFKRKSDLFLQVYPSYKSFKLEEKERERKEIESSEKKKNNLASEKEKLQNEIGYCEFLVHTETNQRIDTPSVNPLPDFAYPNYETSMQQFRQVIVALVLAYPRSYTYILPSYEDMN